MASLQTIRRGGRAGWALTTAIHDALRRDLDQLIHTTAARAHARLRPRLARQILEGGPVPWTGRACSSRSCPSRL
jgi:hypothetical protein